jgi:DNA-binding NtrC family response regulator
MQYRSMKTIIAVDARREESLRIAACLDGEFHVVHCADPGRALDLARGGTARAVLIDIDFHETKGLSLIGDIAASRDAPPVIVHTARQDPVAAFEAARRGASAWLGKPCGRAELASAIRRALLGEPSAQATFVGRSRLIREASERLRLYAPSRYPVLILGESGTGKELAALALHELSGRHGAFIPRNCAAFPGELVESELFGSERGAYTGAQARPGAFELARDGSLFLDEIGEASPAFMPKLLRVLETGEYWRLGGRQAERAEVRFISATARRLGEEAREGRFRPDLLYRINTLCLELPPLRERREDIPDLAGHFLLGATGGRKFLSEAALACLVEAPWPGNVRELRNAIQRAAVLAGPREMIERGDLEL